MASSLESLVENLKDETNSNFHCLKAEFPDHHRILCQKGFYPYEWFDNVNKFDFQGLPKIDRFYSCLSQKHVSPENYKHAETVYEKLNCQSFKDYHLAYLKCDVLLLADVFENFRKTCVDYYKLDPANYICPRLSLGRNVIIN